MTPSRISSRLLISIHALLAESDRAASITPTASRNFYPRSPCGERLNSMIHMLRFFEYFYPRSPCGERLDVNNPVLAVTSISIHALLAESDRRQVSRLTIGFIFLSTLSLRRATINTYHRIFGEGISIHALLAESDRLPTALRTPHHRFLSTLSLRRATLFWTIFPASCGNFYPRSPCGERLTQTDLANRAKLFLSTLSLRRATLSFFDF